jgi:hypothetical protein
VSAVENGRLPAAPVECTMTNTGVIGKQTGPSSAMLTGLTKREAFAIAAMQGLAAWSHHDSTTWTVDDVARKAVQAADALLAALDPVPDADRSIRISGQEPKDNTP